MKKMELLAPAGDLEKLKIAIDYGADAVYFGGEAFGLRAGAGNFTVDQIREGVEYAHARGRKAYMTVNIFAHNEDIEKLAPYLETIKDIPIDAFIVSDAGIIAVFKEVMPDAEIHLSTQANTTNYMTAKFWMNQGVKRIVSAREMSFEELRQFKAKVPEMEIETFIHGAMCISYSGRCLLSNFMVQRDANQGACAHPCRWNYALMEEKRPGEYFPVDEDERGTYVFNSKDLCMIEHIPEMIESGIASAKIEGRMKTIFYVATIVRVYREAIDSYYADPENYKFKPEWLEELTKVSNRHFTTGFFLGKTDQSSQNYESSAYIRDYDFIGIVRSYDEASGYAMVEQRNNFKAGQEIEVFGPGSAGFFTQVIDEMYNEKGEAIEVAPHAQQLVKVKMRYPVAEKYMLRRKR
ncbi:MAG: U32 family peptidase [Firmicutes bacterium]|nr:U32 family peptidase [Bacillota bacterium]